MPDKPFFVYLFAPGATHARTTYQGVGRQVCGPVRRRLGRPREAHFARQKELGVIPADTELTAQHSEITAWDDMPDDLKPVLARRWRCTPGFSSTPITTSAA